MNAPRRLLGISVGLGRLADRTRHDRKLWIFLFFVISFVIASASPGARKNLSSIKRDAARGDNVFDCRAAFHRRLSKHPRSGAAEHHVVPVNQLGAALDAEDQHDFAR